MEKILNLFDEYDTDILCVEDADVTYGGILITHVTSGPNGVQAWSGHPDNKHSEEVLFGSKTERESVFNEIVDNF